MGYMRTITVCITQNHPLFNYAETITRLANHLSNAIRFRQRQVLTAVSKPATNWSANEQEVMKEILDTISQMKRPVLWSSVFVTLVAKKDLGSYALTRAS